MREVHRYSVVKMLTEDGNKITYDPHGPEVVVSTHYDAVVAQRDELLEALEFVMTAHGEQLDTAFAQAQAAIAKAKGETPC